MPEIRVVVSEEIDRYISTVVQKGMFGSKAELIRAALIRYFETLPIRVPSGYDDTTVFSPDGRIFQIEYALESAKRGAAIVGLHYGGGVMLVKRRYFLGHFPRSEHVLSSLWEKYRIDKHIGAIPTGLASDFTLIQDKAVTEAQAYKEKTGEPILVEELVNKLALFMQSYTMKKDVRPLGCIIFVGGFDRTGCHLYTLDPSGSYREVLCQIFGFKSVQAEKILKKHYDQSMSLQEALVLIVKAFLKEEVSRPEEITVAVIEAETQTLRKIAPQEITEAWKTALM